MTLALSDWLIIALYFVVSAAIGLAYTRRAGQSLADYFVTGRSLPWWLAGTSMVATTFAADTPLAVAGLVAKYGVAGNWLWWNGAISGILTVFFFSRLWRRAGVLTDVEFAELRYGGRPAAALRGFRGLYLALPINLIIMGWVTRAMVTILGITLDINPWVAAIVLFGITALYSVLAGLWGVIVTDVFQFVVAMGGSILLAVLAVEWIGGLDSLVDQSARHFGSAEAAFSVLPPTEQAWLPLSTLLVFLAVQWWAAWYPGAEPGGGGYVVQRILSAKDERHGLLATLWFNIAHYALRPWPWILVGLVAAIRYPDLANPEEGYVRVMVDVLPSPFKGLMLAAFAAAYMSTISTHLNWGASYLVNDVYLRFIRPDAGPRGAGDGFADRHGHPDGAVARRHGVSHQRRAGLEGAAGPRSRHRPRADPALVLVAGERLVRDQRHGRLVRDVGVASGDRPDLSDTASGDYALTMLITVAVTTVVWLTVTYPHPPRVGCHLWSASTGRSGPVGRDGARSASGWGMAGTPIPGGALSWLNWIAGVAAVYCAVFAVGAMLTGSPLAGGLYAVAAIAAFSLIYRNLRADQTLQAALTETIRSR